MTFRRRATAAESDIKEKLWTRDFIIVMIACSGISFCNYFFTQTLPILAQNMTGTTVYAGLMTTVFTVAALVMRPIAGVLSGRVGRVKILVVGAALSAAACFSYQYCTVVGLLLVARAVQGIGFSLHTTAGGAVPPDIVPKSRLSEGIGIFGLYGTIASAFGPGIALSFIGSGDAKGFMPLFLMSTGIAVVCLVLDTQIRYERRKGKAGQSVANTAAANVSTSDAAALNTAGVCEDKPLPKTYLGFEAGVFVPAVFNILQTIAVSSITAFLSVFALSRNLGYIGPYFLISAAGMFLSRVFFGRIADRGGTDRVVIPSMGAIVVCTALLPLVWHPGLLFAMGFVLGLAQGAVSPAINRMMFERCSAKRRGTASAAYFCSIDIGFSVGSLLFGFIAQMLGFNLVYWCASCFALAAVVIYVLFLRTKKKAGMIPA